MMILFSLALFALAICVVLLLPFLLGTGLYRQYSGVRVVTCPENHRQVAVSFDAMRAAQTAVAGDPSLRIAGCSRWPERAGCGQECIPQALETGLYSEEEVLPRSGPIFHLPVLLAAFAAWVLGAIWHSQYLFRAEWRQALGLSRVELHELGWQFTPHFLTVAAPLLFAYAVAMVLAWIGKQGPILGTVVSILMWAGFVLSLFVFTGLTGLPGDLLRIELGYTFIAAVVIGFTIGELHGKFRRTHRIARQEDSEQLDKAS